MLAEPLDAELAQAFRNVMPNELWMKRQELAALMPLHAWENHFKMGRRMDVET
jgi:hypothetical protein